MSTALQSREQWLTAALTRVTRGWPTASELPEAVRVSVGFPARSHGRGAGRISEHYAASASAGGFVEIFLSPAIGDAQQAVRALALEAAAVALNRRPSDAERVALLARADAVAATLPPYPHDALRTAGAARSAATAADVGMVGADGAPTVAGPGSRLIRCKCGTCGYTARITRRWLSVAVPTCPADAGHGTLRVG